MTTCITIMGDDPIWRCMDSSKPLSREQLERVIQKKKIKEVVDWFEQHFKKCNTNEYLNRCPIVLFQGPTGCGKTSTLRFISNELKIPIKEYSETSDTTALDYDLARSNNGELDEEHHFNHSTLTIDRRKAQKFEQFVINNIRYQTLYSTSDQHNHCVYDDDAAAELDSDDGLIYNCSAPRLNNSQHHYQQPSIKRPSPIPKSKPNLMNTGVIIHVESPLTFARSQRVFLHSIQRILKILRNMSNLLRRRVAIVFETLEGDGESIALPTRVKQSLKVQVFKFNPIIKTNMKKLVESLMELYNIMIEKDTLEQLINDSDGDIRACLNTLQLICNKSSSVPNVLNNKSTNFNSNKGSVNNYDLMPMQQVNKKQKLIHDRITINKLNSSLMRDSSRGFGFFHVLGKIFYQKRLYPPLSPAYNKFNNTNGLKSERYSSLERPYEREYSTEHLADMVDVEPKNLVAWLHHHYYNFCENSDIEKAALFLDNISSVDTVSISSTQSTQFYEARGVLDQLQLHLSIESTTFSLYEDQSKFQSKTNKSSHNKLTTSDGSTWSVKRSVFSSSGDFYSFKKPTSMSLYKVVEDFQKLLDCCTTKLIEAEALSMNSFNVLLDYIPFLARTRGSLLLYDESLSRIVDAIEKINESSDLDYEATHEKLQDLIDHTE